MVEQLYLLSFASFIIEERQNRLASKKADFVLFFREQVLRYSASVGDMGS
jgi:hypothetical protein